MIIYFAGPLFSLAEKEFNRRLADLVSSGMKGVDIILPQDEAKKIMAESNSFAKMFDFCVGSIDRADVVIAILDGPDVDSGTSFEIGYAYSKNKPVIGVRTDPRQLEDRGVNLMISRSMNHMIWLDPGNMTCNVLADKIIEVLRSEHFATQFKNGLI